MLALKHRLIAAGVQCRESDYALTTIERIRTFIRIVRQDLEVQLRDGKLDGSMTPENARQAIYACTIFEDSLRVEYPELLAMLGGSLYPREQPARQRNDVGERRSLLTCAPGRRR